MAVAERLTDAELDDLRGLAEDDRSPIGRLVAEVDRLRDINRRLFHNAGKQSMARQRAEVEVREHRAARTLTDEEQGAMSDARWRLDQGEPMTPHAAFVYLTRLVAIIDRITEEADRA